MAEKYGVKVGVQFDEQSASRDLNQKLQKLADKNKLKLGLSNEELQGVTKLMQDMKKTMSGKLQLDNTKAMQSLNSVTKEIGKIEQTKLTLFNNSELSRVDKIRQSLLETQRIKTNLSTGDVTRTITAEYAKAYSNLGKLFQEEYNIKTKMLGKDKEATMQLNAQLELVKQRQSALQSDLGKANVPNRTQFEAEAYKTASQAKELYMAKQKEVIALTQKESREVARLIENYQKRKQAELDTHKSQYGGLYNKDRVADFQKSLDSIQATGVRDVNKQFQNLNSEFKSLTAETKNSAKAIKAYQKDSISGFDLLTNAIQKFTMVFLATKAMQFSFDFFRKGVQYSLDLNKALTEVSMVTNQSQTQVYALAESYRELSYSMSVLTEDSISAAVEFYRQGLTQQEVMARVAKTTQYAKITNEDFKESAQLLTATVNSMGVEIDRASDVFIKLGDSTATSGSEMAKGLQKAGGQASAMNVEFEKLASWLATISARTREAPESIGTGVKSMMARYQQLTEEGFTEEDGTRINDVAKALSHINIQIADAEGNFKNYAEVMDEVGQKWGTLDSRTKAYIQTAMAGSYQASRFSNLMEGYADSIDLYNTALDSAGTTQQKYNLWLQGSEAYINRVKEQMTTLWSTMFDVKGVNELASVAETALFAINKVANALGTVPTLLLGVASAGSLLNKGIRDATMGVLNQVGDSFIGLRQDLRGSTDEALKASKNYKGLGDSILFLGRPINQTGSALKNMKREFLANTKGMGIFSAMAKTAKTSMISLGTSIDLTRIKMIALKGAMMAVQIGVTLFATAIITKVITAISEWIHKEEKLSAQLKEREQSVQQNISTNNDYIRSLSKMAEEYNRLAGMSPESMSSEDAERFAQIQNEIARIAPEVVIGYDAQGNAIVSLSEGMGGLIDQLEQKNALERQSLISSWGAKQEELTKITKDSTQAINEETKAIEKYQDRLEKAQKNYEGAVKSENIDLMNSYSKEISDIEGQMAKSNATLGQWKTKLNEANTSALQYSSAMAQNNADFAELDDNLQKVTTTILKGQGVNFTKKTVDELIVSMKNPAIEKFATRLATLKAKPDAIKNYSKEIDTLSKGMADAVNQQTRLKSKLDANQIKQIFNLGDAKKASEAQKEVTKSFKDSQKALNDYSGMLKELNKDGKLSAESVGLIAEKYEELIPYLEDQKVLHSELMRLQNEEKNNAVKALEEKLQYNEHYYQQILNKNPEMVNALREAYGTDYENFKTIADAKQEVNNLLVRAIGKSWSELYATQEEGLQAIVDNYSQQAKSPFHGLFQDALGTQSQFSNISKDLLDTINDAPGGRNDAMKAQAQLTQMRKIRESLSATSERLGNLNLASAKGGGSKGKSSKKSTYEIDAYANAMKLLKLRIDELNSSMGKLHKNSWDYIKSLQSKQGLVKQQIALTEQEIAKQNALTKAQTAPEGKTVTEIRDKAYQKTIELRGQLLTFKNELDKLNVERYTATIGIMDDKLAIASRNAEIYKIRAEKWSGNFQDNFKQFDLYIKEISSRTDVLLEKQKYIQNQIWYGKHNSGQIVQMRKDLMEVVQEIDSMTQSLTDAFQAKWDFKIEFDNREFKKFDDELDIVQDKMDILNEKDVKYEVEKQKLLTQKTNLSKAYIVAIEKAKVALVAERDTLNNTTQEWDYINNKIVEYNDKIREVTKSLTQHNRELKSTLEKQLDNLSNMEQKALQIIKKRYEEELNAHKQMIDEKKSEEEKRHKAEINNLDKEKKAIEEKIKLKLRDIDRNESQRDYEKALNKLLKEQGDLQYKYNALALTADSREGQAQRKNLREQIIAKQSEIDEMRHKRGIDLRKENLNDALETEQKAIDAKKKAEDEKYEANKKRLDKELKDIERHYKELNKNDNLYSEARKAILNKEIKYIDGKLMDLTDAIIRYENEWGQGMSIVGGKIKSDIISNLEKAYQTANNLTEVMKQLKEASNFSLSFPEGSTSTKPTGSSSNKRVFAMSDGNTNINDLISAKKTLQSQGFQVIDATNMTKEQMKNLNLTSSDVVVGQALAGHNIGGATRIQGSDRYETEKLLRNFAKSLTKTTEVVESTGNVVYGWGNDLKNAKEWLSGKGYEFKNSQNITPEELERILKSGDIVVGGKGVSPISDDVLSRIGVVRLGGENRDDTLQQIMNWAKYGGVPKFHTGGIMPHEGLAFLDKDEVILTTQHQKDFFNFFESLPKVKSVMDYINLPNYNGSTANNAGGITIDGGLINIYGDVTDKQLDRVQDIAENQGLGMLTKALKMKGTGGRV